jgi:hypothetical protein
MTIGKTLMKIDLLAGLENTAEIQVYTIWGRLVINNFFKVQWSLKICKQRILIAIEPQNKLVLMNIKMYFLKNKEQEVFNQII